MAGDGSGDYHYQSLSISRYQRVDDAVDDGQEASCLASATWSATQVPTICVYQWTRAANTPSVLRILHL